MMQVDCLFCKWYHGCYLTWADESMTWAWVFDAVQVSCRKTLLRPGVSVHMAWTRSCREVGIVRSLGSGLPPLELPVDASAGTM